MTLGGCCVLREFFRAHNYILCLLALLPPLLTVQSAAQTVVGPGLGLASSQDMGDFSDDLFQNTGFAAKQGDSSPTQCEVRIVENKVVASNRERREVSYHVQPPGIIPDPKVWPWFAWSDTSLGVVRTRDGSGYLFFGSDGGCHENCNDQTKWRWGSITVSQGTLDHPLGEPLGDPNPAVHEFAFPISANLPANIDYAGGGPVYRVPKGEPGAGSLIMVYHIERNANPLWSWTGLAKSTDEGLTWQDLGLILSVPHAYKPHGASDVGENPLVPYTDPTTGQKYFYIFFPQHCWTATAQCSDFTWISVARAPYEEVLAAASAGNSVSTLFNKYYQGEWDQPGLGGLASETFAGVAGETEGDFQIVWSAYRNRFVAIMDNAQYIAYGESVDGLDWPPMQVLLADPRYPVTVYGYANAVGLGADPGVLGDTFYSYYTDSLNWQPASVRRLTITTAASATSIVPFSAKAGGAAFTLTLNGDHFVRTSTVMWNGSPRATTYIGSSRITAQILASDIGGAGEAIVAVSNPAPCGGISNAESFTID